MIEIIATIGLDSYTISNNGTRDATFVIEKPERQEYFRKTFNGKLEVTGDLFDALVELLIADDCQDIDIVINDDSVLEWAGTFNISNCEFDFDRCNCVITPVTNDDYAAYVRRGDEAFDIFTEATREALVYEYQFGDITYSNLFGGLWVSITELLENIVSEIGGHSFASDFFTADTNYVTNAVNLYKHLFIAQKSDIKRVDSSEPVREAFITFNQLTDILKNMLNLYYFIDNGVFRIEHISYFVYTDFVDIRPTTGNYNKLEFVTDNKFKFETFNHMDYDRTQQIIYSSNCVKNTDNEIIRAVNVNTELNNIALNASQANGNIESDSGWCITAAQLDTGVYYAKPDRMFLNTLITRFFRHKASASTSNIGTMFSVKPDKFQEIPYSFCTAFDLEKTYRTDIADKLQVLGNIVRIERGIHNRTGQLILSYGYQDTTQYPALSVIITQDSQQANGFRLYATFSDTTPVGSTITVAWTVFDDLGGIHDSNTQSWAVSGVIESMFAPNWDPADLVQPGFCVAILFTMDFDLQSFTQPASLIC